MAGVQITCTFSTAVPPSAPIDITLSDVASLTDAAAVGTTVGTLSAVDPNVGDTFTFSLTSNPGGKYSITGNLLKVAAALTAGADAITIQVADQTARTFSKAFNITVTAASSGTEYAHLSNAAAAQALGVKAEFQTNGWDPDISAVSWDETIVFTNALDLFNWGKTSTVNGSHADPTKNQRVQLAAAGTFTLASHNGWGINGHDWLANGKVCLVEPQDVNNKPLITIGMGISGSRGVYVRNLDFVGTVTNYGGDAAGYAPQTVKTVTITNGGAGWSVNDVITGVKGPTSVWDNSPILHVTAVSGGVVTGVSVFFGGGWISTLGVPTWIGVGTGFTATAVLENTATAPQRTASMTLARNATYPLPFVVIIENCRFGPNFGASPDFNPVEYPSVISATNGEQLYFRNNQINGANASIKGATVRRYLIHGNDFQHTLGDIVDLYNSSANTGVGADPTKVYTAIWPDGLVYEWAKLNTIRNFEDSSNALNSQGEELGFWGFHCDCFQNGTAADGGSYQVLIEYNAAYCERVTYSDRNTTTGGASNPTTRYASNSQFHYTDDLHNPFKINLVTHSNIAVVSAYNVFTSYNGSAYIERNTGVRPGAITPQGSAPVGNTQDTTPWLYSRILTGSTGDLVNEKDNIYSSLNNGTPRAASYTSSGSIIANPKATFIGSGSAYADIFSGTFTVDGQGRQSYTFLDDGSQTQAQFRAQLYAQFTPRAPNAAKGALDPSTWPAS